VLAFELLARCGLNARGNLVARQTDAVCRCHTNHVDVFDVVRGLSDGGSRKRDARGKRDEPTRYDLEQMKTCCTHVRSRIA
jgi:hypothetical protein